jgi:hypothetical protein
MLIAASRAPGDADNGASITVANSRLMMVAAMIAVDMVAVDGSGEVGLGGDRDSGAGNRFAASRRCDHAE